MPSFIIYISPLKSIVPINATYSVPHESKIVHFFHDMNYVFFDINYNSLCIPNSLWKYFKGENNFTIIKTLFVSF